ncbi:MAG: TetR/AcrR family transcriptional regulator [Burkholderiaceae bacterium]
MSTLLPSPRARAKRSDGLETRQHILNVAGTLFAEKGFSRTTSKEICAAAGCNQAAVNYHFASREGLYAEVLIEAHKQIVTVDELQRISAEFATPQERLSHLLRGLLTRFPDVQQHWGMRVLIHEMLAPSHQVPVLIRDAVLPKVRIMFELVGAVLRLPPDHPRVQRAMAFVMLPCVMLLVAPKAVRHQVLPAIEADSHATVEEMLRYVNAGLAALAGSSGLVD